MLEMVGFKANRISNISEKAISSHLRWLILTNNCITQLPKSIGNCTRLQKFPLAGNQLTELPEEMANCRNLELLRISANHIKELPEWLLMLPKLAWLAYSDNPCSEIKYNNSALKEISWDELIIKEQLGEGASGIISKAIWNKKEQQKIAVKVFKGEVTSDGLPLSEMNACAIADNHECLVTLLGKITNHPQQKEGLVFELIPTKFKNLGKPPSFETCTRDTFEAGTVFTINELIDIALHSASVLEHLHDKGIMHGDFYAHNVMIDQDANTLLGDFGAATLYNTKAPNALLHEKLDVRAYGCLLDDLLERLEQLNTNKDLITELVKLKNDCLHEIVSQRPNLKDIKNKLNSIKYSLLCN
jgi:serine/threonine protein kinase